MPFFICSLLLLFSHNPNAHGSELVSSNQIWEMAYSRDLQNHSRWLALGHYHKTLFGNFKSDVQSDDFFLAKGGDAYPAEELKATIHAFFAPPQKESPDLHAQCRFPARLTWLKKELQWDGLGLPSVTCTRYNQFSYQGSIESISLIFATGYLSNPASYFGHPLVRFNLPRAKMPNSLLDTSVNYGAMTPSDENPVTYALKGLLGGYKASFTHRQFFYSNHAYGELELRDLWEYKLNLTKFQVDQIVGHTWEILGRNFDYMFLSKNCAWAFGQLLEDETGVRLVPHYLPYSLPFTLFDNLAHKKNAEGKSLITSVALTPSRQSRLTAGFYALDKPERDAVRSVAEKHSVTQEYRGLTAESRAKVTETLFDYYSFLSVGEAPDEKIKNLRRELVIERLKLPVSPPADKSMLNLRPPHEGQKPLLTRLSYFDSVQFGNGGEFRIRPAYYDYLAIDSGRASNSSVRAWDIAVVFADETFWLKRFDIINVETLNISQTGLPGDGGLAWKFNTGFEAVNLACTNCAAFKIEAGVGKAVRLFDRQVFFAMLDARAGSAAAGSGHFAGTPRAGAILDLLPSGYWRAELSAGYRHYLRDKNDGEAILRFENRFGSNREWDIRLAYEKHVTEQTSVSYSRYW